MFTVWVLLAASAVTGLCSYVRKDCLVAVSNVDGGIGAKIVCDRDDVVYQRNFSGSLLSPLNTNKIWLENLTTDAEAATVGYILLLPLAAEQIGMLEIRYSDETGEWTTEFSTLELQQIDGPCQILFVQDIREVLYAICASSSASFLRLYEIALNKSVPPESTARIESYATSDGSITTNVAYVDSGSRNYEKHFYFVRDGYISRVTPASHDLRNEFDLALDECVNLTCNSIEYNAPDHILIYCNCCNEICTPYGINYNIHNREITNEPANEGLPYNCPDSITTVTVYVTTKQFHVRGELYNLTGEGFHHGLCSGISTELWFAYQDNTGQIFVADISSSFPVLHRVSENGCLQGPSCNPVGNVSDYLVIQEFDKDNNQIPVKAIRPHTNNSVVFEMNNSQPCLFALLSIPSKVCILPSSAVATETIASSLPPLPSTLPPSLSPSSIYSLLSTSSPTPSPTVNMKDRNVLIVALTLLGAMIVIFAVTCTIVCILPKLRKKNCWQVHSIDATSPTTNGTPSSIQCQQISMGAGQTCAAQSEDGGEETSMVAPRAQDRHTPGDIGRAYQQRNNLTNEDERNRLELNIRAVSGQN